MGSEPWVPSRVPEPAALVWLLEGVMLTVPVSELGPGLVGIFAFSGKLGKRQLGKERNDERGEE